MPHKPGVSCRQPIRQFPTGLTRAAERQALVIMIDPKKFYTKDDYPDKVTQNKIWNNIRGSVFSNRRSVNSFIDLRSFSFGVVFTAAVFLFAFFVIKMTQGVFSEYNPETQKVNRSYSDAANELEKVIPDYIQTLGNSERTKELLDIRLEELKNINNAINQYKTSFSQKDITKIKEQRLLQLYQLKIDAINKIIQLKGDSWL